MGALGRVWEMGEERTGDGSSKRVECGRKGGEITQHCLKFAIEKWLNDSKNKRKKISTTFRNEGCHARKKGEEKN